MDTLATLEDVLLYVARHVPASPADLAVMEDIIRQAFAAPASPGQPGEPGQPAG
jgi:hypothetical protein